MQVPLDIKFEGLEPSEFVAKRVEEEVAKLEGFFSEIVSCHVVVSLPHQHHNKGNLYEVKVLLTLPWKKAVAVDRQPGNRHAHEDVYVAIRDSFKAARRQLQDELRKVQGKVKAHEESPLGKVSGLFSEQGYGFILSSDSREIYFHENAVEDDDFKNLTIGCRVNFREGRGGEKGPQATFVKVAGKACPPEG